MIARRLVTIPAVVLGLVVVGALSPALLLLALLVDAVTPRRRLASTRLTLFLLWFLATETLGLGLLLGIGLLSLGDRARRAARTWAVQRLYTALLLRGVRTLFSLRFAVEGGELAATGPMLVLVRHASIIDTLVPGVFIAGAHRIRLRYVLKRELLVDPCLDVAGHWLPNHFVARDGSDSEREVAAVRALKGGLGPDEGVLLYPEGTRFTPAKRARALAALTGEAKARAERLTHLLPMRPGGVLALLDAPPATDVLFVGHHGLEGLATVADIAGGALVGRTVSIRFWREPAAAVPAGREERQAWLAERWERLDAWLGERAAAEAAGAPAPAGARAG